MSVKPSVCYTRSSSVNEVTMRLEASPPVVTVCHGGPAVQIHTGALFYCQRVCIQAGWCLLNLQASQRESHKAQQDVLLTLTHSLKETAGYQADTQPFSPCIRLCFLSFFLLFFKVGPVFFVIGVSYKINKMLLGQCLFYRTCKQRLTCCIPPI